MKRPSPFLPAAAALQARSRSRSGCFQICAKSLPAPARAAGRMPFAFGAAPLGVLDGSAWSWEYLSGWRGVLALLQGSWGGGGQPRGATADEERLGRVSPAACSFETQGACAGWWISAAAAGARSGEPSICCRAPVAMLLAHSLGQWPNHGAPREALVRLAPPPFSAELGGAVRAALSAARPPGEALGLAALWPLANQPRSCPEAHGHATTPRRSAFAAFRVIETRPPLPGREGFFDEASRWTCSSST